MNNLSILVIDDQEAWLHELQETLQTLGPAVHIDTASSSEAAYRYIFNNTYDLAIVDIRLKDFDMNNVEGMELVRELRSSPLNRDRCAIIVHSAYGTKEQLRRAFNEYRVDDFLSKEYFESESFLQLVQKIIYSERYQKARPHQAQLQALHQLDEQPISQAHSLDQMEQVGRDPEVMYRFEIEQAEPQAAQRISETELLSAVGLSAFELIHRLGNDLGLVKSHVMQINRELTALGVSSSAIEAQLNLIVRDVQLVLNLGHNLREDIAKLHDEASAPYDISSTQMSELLQQVVHAYPNLPTNIQVSIESDANIRPVRSVFAQVADILHNLFVNAVEAMPSGGNITLRARNAGNHVEIQVADTGIGISKTHLPRIFDLFYSTKGGSGFGLWSARRRVLANGGDLIVESQPGKGTIFTLILPQAREKDAEASLAPSPSIATPQQLSFAPETTARLAELESLVKELELRDRRTAETLSMIAHELITPLANIGLYARNLLKGYYGELTDVQQQNLQVIQSNYERIKVLSEKFLARHKLERGQIQLLLVQVNLEEAIIEALQLYAGYAERSQVSVEHFCDLDLHVSADKALLVQMIGNLVDNAIKFNNPGGNVTITATHLQREVQIAVKDNGKGIAPEHIETIFEWEFQIDRSSTREKGGIGLGLSLARSYARLHGGDLCVVSTPEQGSVFTIALPTRDFPPPVEEI